jgi:hypothetical protein
MNDYIMTKLDIPEIKHQNFIQWTPVPIFSKAMPNLNNIPILLSAPSKGRLK